MPIAAPVSSDGEQLSSQNLHDLIPIAYDALRNVARLKMMQKNAGFTITPTDLVNEVLLRLLSRGDCKYNGEAHLLSVAALAMHNVLVDRARRRGAAKRGGLQVRLDIDDVQIVAPADNMLEFHAACEVVRGHSEGYFELVLLRVYAGLSCKEIAAQRNLSCRTVERQWKFVKALLKTQLRSDHREISTSGAG